VARTAIWPVARTAIWPVARTAIWPVARTAIWPVARTAIWPVARTAIWPVAHTAIRPVARTSIVPAYFDDGVKMVRHYHEFIQFDFGADFSRFQPFIAGDLPKLIQDHHPIPYFPKQTRPLMTADGDEIKSILRIIIMAQTNRAAVMDGGIIHEDSRHMGDRM
ncbi:MAG: hypothetical protein PHE55_14770, partial [Methylococcaceae bacterium]|nr:hypothetical protein [Methylococcaceae bacterium]